MPQNFWTKEEEQNWNKAKEKLGTHVKPLSTVIEYLKSIYSC